DIYMKLFELVLLGTKNDLNKFLAKMSINVKKGQKKKCVLDELWTNGPTVDMQRDETCDDYHVSFDVIETDDPYFYLTTLQYWCDKFHLEMMYAIDGDGIHINTDEAGYMLKRHYGFEDEEHHTVYFDTVMDLESILKKEVPDMDKGLQMYNQAFETNYTDWFRYSKEA
ncbi:MAG: hypothetical protein IJ875_04315, partial [Solobacterium sp.]|nr:hypothetical protein [Solobacterium sp.]